MKSNFITNQENTQGLYRETEGLEALMHAKASSKLSKQAHYTQRQNHRHDETRQPSYNAHLLKKKAIDLHVQDCDTGSARVQTDVKRTKT